MKVILVSKNFPYYENLPDRKSYISVKDGQVLDDKDTLLKNQKKYMDNFFPTEISAVTDKTNIKAEGDFIRKISGISFKNYPTNMYPNTFEFWNNVNYAMIIYENGFIEYCYITKRTCLNITSENGVWDFVFSLDIYNTYWISAYEAFRNAKGISLDVERLHEGRFDRRLRLGENNEQIFYFVQKFLFDQNSAFWNKEEFEQSIQSKITVKSGVSFVPWTEPNDKIITRQFDLLVGYKGFQGGTLGLQRFFETKYNRTGFPAVVYSTFDLANALPGEVLNSFYGLNNIFFIGPLVNKNIVESVGSSQVHKLKQQFERYASYFGGIDYDFAANLLGPTTRSDTFVGIIYTPKPIFPLKVFDSNSFRDFCYPNRKNVTANNLNVDYLYQKVLHLAALPGNKEGLAGDVLATNNFRTEEDLGLEPLPTNRNSFLNCMADERIDIADFSKNLYVEEKSLKIVQEVDVALEPKIYDEELFNVSYSHFNQDPLIISPKWYFYQNLEDLLDYKSIFIEGYQFVSLSFVSLTQYLSRGLYEEFNKNGIQNSITIHFSPWMSFNQSTEAEFLARNASQMNTNLNNIVRSGGLNALHDATMEIAGKKTMQTMMQVGGVTFFDTMFKMGISYANAKLMQDAKIKDIAHSTTNNNDNSSANSYKILVSENGNYMCHHINEIDKRKIWTFHAYNGYFLGKNLIIGNDLNSLATRIYYNFWKINKFKMALQDLSISNAYKEYFDFLLENGVTFWHEFEHGNYSQNQVGNYTNENWEIEFLKYLPDNTNENLQ